MRQLKFILAGIAFGIIMVKSEAASWFRIQEMFRFQSFRMYGIIGTAVTIGALGVFLIKRMRLKNVNGHIVEFHDKEPHFPKYLIGGTIFGLGWALTGACPGPMFVNLGYGYPGMAVVIVGALIGTFFYGAVKRWLPHR